MPAIKLDVVLTCYHCNGTGEVPFYPAEGEPPQGTVVCSVCEGDGEITVGTVNVTSIINKIDTISDDLKAVDNNVKSNIETCEKILKIVEK